MITLIVGERDADMLAELEERSGISSSVWKTGPTSADQSYRAESMADALVHPWATMHPTHGCRAFAAAVRLSLRLKWDLFIVTTLDYLTNAMGEWIDGGLVGRDEVIVVVCYPLEHDSGHYSTEHRFDERGVLGDEWPIGFLMPGNLPGCAP